MSAAEVEELQAKLAKSEEQRQKLRTHLGLLKEKVQNTTGVLQRLEETKGALTEERQLRSMAEAALEQQRQEVATARKEAAAAGKAAQLALAAANVAKREADAARKELGTLQAQLQQLQATCDGLEQAVVSGGGGHGAAARTLAADGPLAAALQAQLSLMQQEQRSMQQEMLKWRAALGPLAALAAGADGSAAALPAPPQQQEAAVVMSPRKRGRPRGSTSAKHALPAPAPAAGQGPEAAEAPPAPAAAVPADDARARAVAARQAAAHAAVPAGGGSSAAAKRPRAAADGGPAAAQTDVLAEALGSMSRHPAKRGRLAAGAATAAVPDAASPRASLPFGAAVQQQRQQQQRQQQSGVGGMDAPLPGAPTPAVAAEASLAISANELHGELQREPPIAADEAAQLLGRITAATCGGVGSVGGGSLTLSAVHQVAADLQVRLTEGRLPLPLLLACFETAVLDCAAPKPRVQQLLAAEAADAAAAASASPAGWFAPDRAHGQQQQQEYLMPYAAVWCSREALTTHRLHWLLHCAGHIQRLEQLHAKAVAAAGGMSHAPGRQHSEPFGTALQQHMYRLVVRCCCLAAGGSRGGSTSRASSLRHTETEVCALAAATAGLCRASRGAEALWSLLLDLLTCPTASPAAVLPPLAAALDVWPALAAPDASSDPASASWLRSFHSALQYLCSQAAADGHPTEQHEAAAAAPPGSESPPPLLLERQPAAAATFLHRLGQQLWGWRPGAQGSSSALAELRAAQEQLPKQHERGTAPAPAAAAAAAALAPAVPTAPAADDRVTGAPEAEPAAEGQEEYI